MNFTLCSKLKKIFNISVLLSLTISLFSAPIAQCMNRKFYSHKNRKSKHTKKSTKLNRKIKKEEEALRKKSNNIAHSYSHKPQRSSRRKKSSKKHPDSYFSLKNCSPATLVLLSLLCAGLLCTNQLMTARDSYTNNAYLRTIHNTTNTCLQSEAPPKPSGICLQSEVPSFDCQYYDLPKKVHIESLSSVYTCRDKKSKKHCDYFDRKYSWVGLKPGKCYANGNLSPKRGRKGDLAFYVIKRDEDNKVMVSNGKGTFVPLPEDICKDTDHCLINEYNSLVTSDKRFLFIPCENESTNKDFGAIFDLKNNKFLKYRIPEPLSSLSSRGTLIPSQLGNEETGLVSSEEGDFFIVKMPIDEDTDVEIINLKNEKSAFRKNNFYNDRLTGLNDESFEKIAEQKIKLANCPYCRYMTLRGPKCMCGNHFNGGIFCEDDGVYNDNIVRDSISKREDMLLVVEEQKKLFVSFDSGKKKLLLPTKNKDAEFNLGIFAAGIFAGNRNDDFAVIQYSFEDSKEHVIVFDNIKKEVSKLFPEDLIAKEDSGFKKSHAYSEKEDSDYIVILKDRRNVLYKKNYASGTCQKINMNNGKVIKEWSGIRNWPAV